MNTTDFLECLRQTGTLPTVSENWGATQLLSAATDALRTRFAEEIVDTGSGYWRHQEVVNTVAGQNEYKINPRAIVQGLQKFEVSVDGGNTWNLMRITTLGSDGLLESTRTGSPIHYSHYSDYVRVYPTPSNSTTKLRFTFYLSPSKLIETVATGVVVSKPSALVVRVSGDPTSYLSASNGTLDVVNTTGCNEVALFDVAYTSIAAAGGGNYDITFPAGTNLTRVAAGQVVRAVDTTDQIPLARELHSSLAVYTSAIVLVNIGDSQQGEKLAAKAGADIRRIVDLSIPRDKSHPQKIKPRNSYLRRNIGRRWV